MCEISTENLRLPTCVPFSQITAAEHNFNDTLVRFHALLVHLIDNNIILMTSNVLFSENFRAFENDRLG